MLNRFSVFSVGLPATVHERALKHLLRADGQEDVCFGLWIPSQGRRRLTGLVSELVLPTDGERYVRGIVTFTPEYFLRAFSLARKKGTGLVLMHSHPGSGWQRLSKDDFSGEARHSGAVLAGTGLPLLGMTVGSDGAWSGRFWRQVKASNYDPAWCESVRVAGESLEITWHPQLRPAPWPRPELERSIGVWGQKGQAEIASLHVGIVGLGNVGSIVSEALARMGVEQLSLIDYDEVEVLNLDRILGATHRDIGRLKIDVAAENACRSSTADRIRINRCEASVVEDEGYHAALDCDVLFSCVDRPWARRVLNHVAYAHTIPVVDGGILVRVRGEEFVGADWHVHTAGPGRKCLECVGAFDPSLVGVERDGLLEDPSYLNQLDPNHILLRHENVFPFGLNVASLEVLQMAALVVGPRHNLGNQNYHHPYGIIDKTIDEGCSESCLYCGLVATGDSQFTVTGLDYGAERHRERVCKH